MLRISRTFAFSLFALCLVLAVACDDTPKISGIGVEIGPEDGKFRVLRLIRGMSAEKAGIVEGDLILSVNGRQLEGLTLDAVVNEIIGPTGTIVHLTILSTGEKTNSLRLVRSPIPQVEVEKYYKD